MELQLELVMSDIIRRFANAAMPNSDWIGSRMPHKNPQQTYITDLDMPGVEIEGIPQIPQSDSQGHGSGRPLFDPSAAPPVIEYQNPYRRRGVFRDPDSYDNRT